MNTSLTPYIEKNLHKLGKQLTNPAVVQTLGANFEDIDLIIKGFICRCLLRDQFPVGGNGTIFSGILTYLTVKKKIVKVTWTTAYYAMKISNAAKAMTGRKRIEKFILNEQIIFLHKLAFIFVYSSSVFTLRCLENFDNSGPVKKHLFPRNTKETKNTVMGISGWFLTDMLTNYILLNILTGQMENSKRQ